MTDLNPSGLMVSLVQTATLLPLVLLAVPGGTLGDLADRKKVLLIRFTVPDGGQLRLCLPRSDRRHNYLGPTDLYLAERGGFGYIGGLY